VCKKAARNKVNGRENHVTPGGPLLQNRLQGCAEGAEGEIRPKVRTQVGN
jgi:hypothetical protein